MKRICLFIRLRVLRYFQDGYPEMDQKTWQQDDNLMSKWCPLKRYWDPIFIPTISISIRCIWGWLLKGPPSRGVFPHHFFLWPFHPPCEICQISSPLRWRKPEISQGWLRVPQRHSRLRYRWEQLDSSVTCRTGNSRQWGAYGPIIWLDVDGNQKSGKLISWGKGSWNPTIYGSIFYIPGGWEWDFWTINSVKSIST